MNILNNRFWVLLSVFVSSVLFSCSDDTVFVVKHTADSSIKIDGQAEAAWQTASKITDFKNPWNRAVSPATSLSILHDDNFFYCLFTAADDDIVQTTVTSERDIDHEDRVELFFAKDRDMNDYYGLEIDLAGNVMSYHAHYYRDLNFEWEPPFKIQAVGSIKTDGYTVEIALPLDFVKSFAQPDDVIYMGAYRAEFSHKDGKIIENWLTWINPHTEKPDFHVPASLGRIKFAN